MTTRNGTLGRRLGRLESAVGVGPERLFVRLGQRGPAPVWRPDGGPTTVHLPDVPEGLREAVPSLSHFDLTRGPAGAVVMTSAYEPDEPPDSGPWVGDLAGVVMACATAEQRDLLGRALERGQGWRVMAAYE